MRAAVVAMKVAAPPQTAVAVTQRPTPNHLPRELGSNPGKGTIMSRVQTQKSSSLGLEVKDYNMFFFLVKSYLFVCLLLQTVATQHLPCLLISHC